MESQKDLRGGSKSIVTPYFDYCCELIIEYLIISNERAFLFLLSDPDEDDDYETILTHFYLQLMVLLKIRKDQSKKTSSESLPIFIIEEDIRKRAEKARHCIKENDSIVSEIILLKLTFRGFQKTITRQTLVNNNMIVPDEFQLSVKKAFFDSLS
jgi:hypothetical protein